MQDELVIAFAKDYLKLPITKQNAIYYATLTMPILKEDDAQLALTGIWLYATYRTVFHLRAKGNSTIDFKESMLKDYVFMAIKGHNGSRKTFKDRTRPK